MARFYLLVSAALLLVVALAYGIAPERVLPRVLHIAFGSRDMLHVFRAQMGLYLALLSLWTAGAFRPRLTRTAVVSEVVVMVGLALGRLLSVLADGLPSPIFSLGMLLEFLLALWGYWVLKRLSTLTHHDA